MRRRFGALLTTQHGCSGEEASSSDAGLSESEPSSTSTGTTGYPTIDAESETDAAYDEGAGCHPHCRGGRGEALG